MLEELELLLKAAGIKFTRAERTINGWDEIGRAHV